MSTTSVHSTIVSREQHLLDQLLDFQPGNLSVDSWLLVLAHNKAMHLIELAAHREGIIKNDKTVLDHADRLEFLITKGYKARQYYNKLHIIAIFLQYGVTLDETTLLQALKLFQERPARQFVPKFLEIIEQALK